MARVSTALVELPNRPHALYRFYDRTDVLLYVGISANPFSRFGGHRGDKPWWTSVARIEIQQFPTRREALDAETEAIRTEGPLFNEKHNRQARHEIVPIRLSDIDGDWLLENWGKVPAVARDVVETPAWQLGRDELAEWLFDGIEPEDVKRAEENARGAIEAGEADQDLKAETVAAAFRMVTDESLQLRESLNRLLRRVLGDGFASRHTQAANYARSRLGNSYTDIEGLTWLAETVSRELDVRRFRSLPHATQIMWMRAAANLHGARSGRRDVEEFAAECEHRFHLSGALPSNLCGVHNDTSICVESAAFLARFNNCPKCQSKDRYHRHQGLCGEHLHAALEEGSINEYRLVPSDPWETF